MAKRSGLMLVAVALLFASVAAQVSAGSWPAPAPYMRGPKSAPVYYPPVSGTPEGAPVYYPPVSETPQGAPVYYPPVGAPEGAPISAPVEAPVEAPAVAPGPMSAK